MLNGSARFCIRSVAGLMVVSVASFAVITTMPSDPVAIAIRAWNLPATDDTIAALRAEWGLDQPFLLRYLRWLGDFVTGDWGRSFRTGDPVLAAFIERLPISLGIGLASLGFAMAAAIPLGFFAALNPNGRIDRMSRILSVFVQAVPSFWLGLMLLWVLGAELRWIRPFADDWTAYLLPILLIALHSLAVLARVYRRDLIETTGRPHYRTALAKGLSERQALWRHGHRSALYALLAAVRSEAGWAIGSTATMEVLFALPGISQFVVQSVAARDHMVLQAYVMVTATWLIVMNGAAALGARMLDPRIG